MPDRARSCAMKNRMRELRSFGSVRGEGRKVLAYSENQLYEVLLRRANCNGGPVAVVH